MTPEEIRRVLEYYQDLGIKSIYRRGSQLTAPLQPAAAEPEAELFDKLPPLPPRVPASGKPAAPPPASESLSWDDLPPLPPKPGRFQQPQRPPAPPARPSTAQPAAGAPSMSPAASRGPASNSWDTPSAPHAAPQTPSASPSGPNSLDSQTARTSPAPQPAPNRSSAPNSWDTPSAPIPTRIHTPQPPTNPMIDLLPLAPENDSLDQIRTDIGDCRRCRLCEGRNKIVFGSGNVQSPLVFVGEGPGADEDASGLPFVGRAGQLLTQMIEGTASKEGIAIKRPDVYICNVVKCRPPENRAPQPDEMEICGQFLFRQLSAIKPKAICALGSTAAKAVLGTKDGVTKLRGNWHKWRDVPVMVTYHPSYLLRPYNQNAKREAWEDLKKVLHFVYD